MPGTYRIRVGRWRIVDEIDEESQVDGILRVGAKHGPEFYEDLLRE